MNKKKKNLSKHIVPKAEAWVYENPDVIHSIQKGIHEIETGRTRKVKTRRRAKRSI